MFWSYLVERGLDWSSVGVMEIDEFVERTAPHTEADPTALLTQFLVAFAAAGRKIHYAVEATSHSAETRKRARSTGRVPCSKKLVVCDASVSGRARAGRRRHGSQRRPPRDACAEANGHCAALIPPWLP